MDINEAVNEAGKFTRFIKAFEKLQETAEALQSAAQAVSEREAAKAVLDAQLASKREELAQVGVELELVREAVKGAQAQAASALADAKAKADEAVATAVAVVEIAAVDKAQIESDIKAAKRELAALSKELDDAKAIIAKAGATKAALAALG